MTVFSHLLKAEPLDVTIHWNLTGGSNKVPKEVNPRLCVLQYIVLKMFSV